MTEQLPPSEGGRDVDAGPGAPPQGAPPQGGPATREAELLRFVAKELVEDPNAVVVTEERDRDFLKLHLQVAEPDIGKVIGRGGRIAKATRALLKVMATRDGIKVNLEID